ncbi:hypothetical protein VRRI112168_00505 [Vreelandella rituensis]|uniref:Uncharacterized protein n=1 Tax=Vreelandella rituensis TaxID=2282306 RepID=A0A368UBP7_9GAMM|nr:hypothetical protein [Halomonas rituensis]RCV93822.1 hypothetical protein DU506_01305 [Halomonas rituensis]
MAENTFYIDARQLHCPRPGYVGNLIEMASERAGDLQSVADHCGLTRQYLHALVTGCRSPSYACQVCIEQYLEGLQGGDVLVIVDAPQRFRRSAMDARSLVAAAIRASGGVCCLAGRTGASRQYLHTLLSGNRRLRYPFQVMLEAIIEERRRLVLREASGREMTP